MNGRLASSAAATTTSQGAGMAGTTYDVDAFRAAQDCRTLFEAGNITLISEDRAQRPPLRIDGIQFGSDTSDWARDGECDDPRFSGEGMAHGTLSADNAYADRTDCLAAHRGRNRCHRLRHRHFAMVPGRRVRRPALRRAGHGGRSGPR